MKLGIWKKISIGTVAMVFALQTAALAAANLQGVRCHSGSEHDRIVFDLSETPLYDVRTSDDGQTITIDFTDVATRHFRKVPFHSSRIESVSYALKQDHFLVTMKLKSGLTYKVANLHKPARVFIDVLPKPSNSSAAKPSSQPSAQAGKKTGTPDPKDAYEEELAPGLTKKTYVYWDDAGKVTAYFVEADKNLYTVRPALGGGQIPGRETVSGISDRYQAVAAVNASYFNWNGDLLGVTKIDGNIVGTTYITRSAFGILPDGRSVFGKVSYSGTVTMGGVTKPVGGVDCERGADSLTLYNRYYGKTTRTNEYGREYIVRNGRVTAIGVGNSAIPADGWVVSTHGATMDAFAGVKVGDAVSIEQNLGSPWNEAVQILGVGPRLLENGRVHVTAAEEQFPGDIRYGEAPRSAVGVMANGNYLIGVVDGRQKSSHGLTLTAWAQLLQKFGAVDAINFDGGGSSELVVGGQIVNAPSDGSERPVGSALILVKK